jgi:flagellar biosynthesis/type III secretory pathway protein FliH
MPPLKLEVFQTADPIGTLADDGDSQLEDVRLAAYEQGYAAGWEDSTNAQAEDQRKLRADLARNLQAMSFTYHEARTHILRAIGPLLQDLVTHLLPSVARDALGPIVVDTLMPMAEELSEAPVVIVMNPAARQAIEAVMDHVKGLPVTLRDEPSLSEGQVYLSLGESETHIDLDRATADIAAAVRGFFELAGKEARHG